MDTIQAIKYIKEKYQESLQKNISGVDAGIFYDYNHRFFYFSDCGREIHVTKNEMADMPFGIGDGLTEKIINWSQNIHNT